MGSVADHSSIHMDQIPMTTPDSVPAAEFDAFQHVYPAVLDVFIIILCGYISGRTGMISETESQGLNTFTSKFALPAMLFHAMAKLDFSQVNWMLMTCIFISKTVVFAVVLLMTLILSGKPVQFGRAGIFAIFASQSNDFALGYPIIEALYKETRPELLPYIYLVAPVSLLFLNPIGFCLLELQKYRDEKASGSHAHPLKRLWIKTAWSILWGMVSNPINYMTFIGCIANLVFHGKLPAVLDGLLTTFGSAFSASALFYLGLKMVGRMKAFHGFRLVVPALLILAKLLVLPLITRALAEQLILPRNSSLAMDYANFAFLYGTIPTAPTVFVFASQYNSELETVGTSLVLSTFISGPWMFVSAEMLTIETEDADKYGDLLSETQFDVGILGVACAVWVILVIVISRRWRRIPHTFTVALCFSQLLACGGMLMCRLGDPHVMWQHYLQFSLFLSGVFGTRTWTAAIAIALWLLNSRSLCFVLRYRIWFFVVCFGVPILLTGIVMVSGSHTRHDRNPAFHYGMPQLVISALLLLICFTASVAALIMAHMKRRSQVVDLSDIQELDALRSSHRTFADTSDEIDAEVEVFSRTNDSMDIEDLTPIIIPSNEPRKYDEVDETQSRRREKTVVEQTCLVERGCSAEQKRKCRLLVRKYEAANYRPGALSLASDETIKKDVLDPYQQNSHVVLLICLSTSMLIGLFVCFWRIFVTHSTTTGIFIELEFLDGVLMFGQSCFVFAIFGLDTQFRAIPWCSRMLDALLRRPTGLR